VSPTIEFLIAARTLQGVGGALLTPGSLAMIQASFLERGRGKAIGAWSGFGVVPPPSARFWAASSSRAQVGAGCF